MTTRRPARYVVDLSRPGHEIVVTATFPAPSPGGGSLGVFMPRWAPGSYLVREFARHVEWIRARQDGRERPVRKSATDEWQVELGDDSVVTVEYGLYAHEMTVRTNYLAADRALIAGAATFLRPTLGDIGPLHVEVLQPPGWPAPECALPVEDGAFVAADFDELVDSPIAAGPRTVADFLVKDVPHRIAVYGDGDSSAAGMSEDVRATCEAASDIFGDIPCSRYLFIIEIGCGGGLEHAASSVCGIPIVARGSDADWRKALSLVAHEYFHLWNVKRIRPAALGPFDYRREVHTPHLWVAEGLTSYYQHVIGLRAGLVSAERFLTILAAHVLDLESTPGRLIQSLEESSHDAWIKYYRPHENTPNSTVSYYGKGTVAGLVLDLEIRRRTAGERSLDDAFRTLYAAWKQRPDRGFEDEELRAAISSAAGSSMDGVIDEVARGRGDLDVDSRIAAAGLELVRRRSGGGWLGVTLRRAEGKAFVDRVVRGGPAFEAGLAPGEEILALDGFRVDEPDLRSRLDAKAAGDEALLVSVLWGRLREIRVKLGPRPSTDFRCRKLPHADAAARAIASAWLRKPWDELAPLDEPPEDQRGGKPARGI